MSQSKISRIETGRILPSVVDVERILSAIEMDRQTTDELVGLARVANAEYRDIRSSVRRGLHHRQQELANLEANASHVRFFLPALITGLLQTPEYMRQALSVPVDPVKADRARSIAKKLERQAVLHDTSKTFEFLLTESSIRWRLCEPSVMALQIDRLVSLSRLSNLRIGILPQVAQVPDGPMSGFVVYDSRLVTVELFTGQLVLRDPKDIDHYHSLFDFFSHHARWGEEARNLLEGVADDYRQGGLCRDVNSSGRCRNAVVASSPPENG